MNTTLSSQHPKLQTEIHRNLTAILDQINSFHADTQNEFQFLHVQYMNVSKKIAAVLQNLKKLQSILSNKDLNALIYDLNEVKNSIRELNLPAKAGHPVRVREHRVLENVLQLRSTIKKIKHEFRQNLIARAIQKNDAMENLELRNSNINNLITTDLLAMIGILENALDILSDLFIIRNQGKATARKSEYKTVVKFIDFLMHHITDFHGNVENNIDFISHNFEICRETGDEIITSLQYQDIFSQKLNHIISIIENIRIEFDPQANKSKNDNKYSFVLPEICSILIAQVKFLQDEFKSSTSSIIERLNNIGSRFVNSRDKFRKLNHMVNPQAALLFNLPDKKAIPVDANGRPERSRTSGYSINGNAQSMEMLGDGIDRVISEIKTIKGKVKEVIVNALEPSHLTAHNFNYREIETQWASFAGTDEMVSAEKTLDMKHSELIQVSDRLFDEVITSLEAAKIRFTNIEVMYGSASRIISGLEQLVAGNYPWSNDVNEFRKTLALDDFRKTYSMQSERLNHDRTLGINLEEELFAGSPETEKGEVELF